MNEERVKACGACRLCLVKIEGGSHAVTSCTTELKDEMEIETHTPEIEASRKMTLRMLARNYPLVDFRNFPEKPFHKLARQYELTEADFSIETNRDRIDDSHTYIQVDMSRCVECYRCMRICEEVQGQF